MLQIFSQSKDEVALVLFGTDETDNLLSQNDEEYQNIVVKRELAVVNWDFMTLVQEDVKAGNAAGDFIDAMIVAMDHLQEQMGYDDIKCIYYIQCDVCHPFVSTPLNTYDINFSL